RPVSEPRFRRRGRARRRRPRHRAGVRRGELPGSRPAWRGRLVSARLLHRDHGPIGLGQVDAYARPRRARRADRRRRRDRRHAPRRALGPRHDAAAARSHRVRLPELQPPAGAQRRGEHRPAGDHRRRTPGFRLAGEVDQHRRARRSAHASAVGALRRPAAARRGRPRADQPPRRRLRRRADRQPRLELRTGGPAPPAPGGRRVRPDHRDGHPRRRRRRGRRSRPLPGRRAHRRHRRVPVGRAGARPPQGPRL
ncbi:MAG: ABC transporter, ATP-binding protein, partial [uncultured Solirubrobacteraceae bacterium]